MTPQSVRLLLLGAQGQVGWELARSLAPLGTVLALDRQTLDLTDLDAVRTAVRASNATVIANAVAYTQVDLAESEPVLAQRINADAPAVIAAEAARSGALLIHYSTDYVFDGVGDRPYVETDRTAPRTVYGSTKLAGDEAILSSGASAYIFRVGWVYGRRGRNFLRTIERLARERDELRVVADQRGSPTWCRTIAEGTTIAVAQWLAARRGRASPPPAGMYHMAASDHTTWHEFAQAIVAGAAERHGRVPRVHPIATHEYPTPAQRPAWSVLDSTRLRELFGIQLPAWREQLRLCTTEA